MNIRLNYVQAGEGFPLILLHGNGEDYTYFKHQLEPFSAHYRVIIVETRGHGQSPRGEAPFTLEQFAWDLKHFLDQQGITRCHLLGFSDGGNIALEFVLRWPEYVDKLILNGANLFPEGLVQWLQDDNRSRMEQLSARGLEDPAVRAEWEMVDLMASQPRIDPAALGAIRCPTLVVAGEDDVIQEEHTRLIAASIPNSRLEILPSDHFVAKHNWRCFNPVILDFLGL